MSSAGLMITAGLVLLLIGWIIDAATSRRCDHCGRGITIRWGAKRPFLCIPCATQQRIMRALEENNQR